MWLALAGLAAGFGVLTAAEPSMAIVLAIVFALGVFCLANGRIAWWGLLLVALGGSLVLGYAFANVGVRLPQGPLPLADVLLVVLLAGMLLARGSALPRSLPFMFAAGFTALATLRLIIDLPEWGQYAVRDFTLPLEVGFLVVGYWGMRRYGVEQWIRSLRWVFLFALGYFALYPWASDLTAFSPVVGLDQAVPLLGTYQGAGTAASAALFFFALVRPFGRLSYLLASLCLPVIALTQARGLYIAVPAALLVLWLAVGRPRTSAAGPRSPRLRTGIAVVAAGGLAGLLILVVLAPEGRLGAASSDFYVRHVGTLLGNAGPVASSLEDRERWFTGVTDQLDARPQGWIVGLGLGPDLAAGFDAGEGLVRKPHNDYLEILGRLGLLGLALFLGMLAVSVAQIVIAARRAKGQRERFLWWTLAVALVYLTIAATQPLLAYPYGTIPLFTLLGAGLALARSPQKPPAP